jgi:hypothetical protein
VGHDVPYGGGCAVVALASLEGVVLLKVVTVNGYV